MLNLLRTHRTPHRVAKQQQHPTLQRLVQYFSSSTLSKTQSTNTSTEYDVVVIGNGRAAIECAVESGKRGQRVALIDPETISAQAQAVAWNTLRESILHFTGFRHQGFYGKSYATRNQSSNFQFSELFTRVHQVMRVEHDFNLANLRGEGVTVLPGSVAFQSPHALRVTPHREQALDGNVLQHLEEEPDKREQHEHTEESQVLQAQKILLDVGTIPVACPFHAYDGRRILNSTQILSGALTTIPRSLIVIGVGVMGIEVASMINVLPGTTVTLIDVSPSILNFADEELVDTLLLEMRSWGGRFLLGESVVSIERMGDQGVCVKLQSGKEIVGDSVLYTIGHQADTSGLNLSTAGLEPNDRGLISVNPSTYQTSQPHIYAAGDCIGPNARPSTSIRQGQVVSNHMWKPTVAPVRAETSVPYSVHSIPELSFVGKTERELTLEKRNYGTGVAKYSELAKGQMSGTSCGMLKILFDQETLEILGVHILGESSSEILHIGSAAMAMGHPLSYFRDAVFNYPTLAEAYRVAALNGLGRSSLMSA